LDTIEKQKEKESLIQKLNLTSDMFVSKVLEDFASLEEVLELLTGKHYHIVDVRTQYAIRQLVTHSVQLDVYAEEESGGMVHLEIQNRDDDDHIRRVRYDRSCIDTALLDKGADYRELPELLQIFVTKKDFIKGGSAIYDNSKPLSDGVTELYFNLSVESKNEKIRELQKYFLNTVEENESEYFPKLVERVRFIKYGEGKMEMCEIFDQVKEMGREEGLAEGKAEGIILSLKNLIHNAGVTKEQAFQMLGIPMEERPTYLTKL
jgi:hypothetical protein